MKPSPGSASGTPPSYSLSWVSGQSFQSLQVPLYRPAELLTSQCFSAWSLFFVLSASITSSLSKALIPDRTPIISNKPIHLFGAQCIQRPCVVHFLCVLDSLSALVDPSFCPWHFDLCGPRGQKISRFLWAWPVDVSSRKLKGRRRVRSINLVPSCLWFTLEWISLLRATAPATRASPPTQLSLYQLLPHSLAPSGLGVVTCFRVTTSALFACLKLCSLRVGNGNPLQFLPGEFHGQRSLVGYSLWSRRVGHD